MTPEVEAVVPVSATSPDSPVTLNEQEPVAPSGVSADPPVVPDDPVMTVLLAYRAFLQRLEIRHEGLKALSRQINETRQHIRELSADLGRDPCLEEPVEQHELHASKVAVQHEDCSSVIHYLEQIREHVYENAGHAEHLLASARQSLGLLEARMRYISLLEQLLSAQKATMHLEEQQQQAQACLRQLAGLLGVTLPV